MHISISSFDEGASVRVIRQVQPGGTGRITVAVDPTRPMEGTFDVTLPVEVWARIAGALAPVLAEAEAEEDDDERTNDRLRAEVLGCGVCPYCERPIVECTDEPCQTWRNISGT